MTQKAIFKPSQEVHGNMVRRYYLVTAYSARRRHRSSVVKHFEAQGLGGRQCCYGGMLHWSIVVKDISHDLVNLHLEH